MNKPTIQQRAIDWIRGNDTGISSEVIWAVMMGETIRRNWTPVDPSDFGRCRRLFMLIPEWEERIEELRSVSEAWGRFVDNYNEMCRLYKEELPSGTAPKLYSLMKELKL